MKPKCPHCKEDVVVKIVTVELGEWCDGIPNMDGEYKHPDGFIFSEIESEGSGITCANCGGDLSDHTGIMGSWSFWTNRPYSEIEKERGW